MVKVIQDGQLCRGHPWLTCDECLRRHKPVFCGYIVIALGYNGSYLTHGPKLLFQSDILGCRDEIPDFKDKVRRVCGAYNYGFEFNTLLKA